MRDHSYYCSESLTQLFRIGKDLWRLISACHWNHSGKEFYPLSIQLMTTFICEPTKKASCLDSVQISVICSISLKLSDFMLLGCHRISL